MPVPKLPWHEPFGVEVINQTAAESENVSVIRLRAVNGSAIERSIPFSSDENT
jgi:hypothetical protein